ncbi:MAG: aromatic ring-hydroxylating oxygenase subunit alpha, partial [Janthinobacterium lividum]
VLFTRGKDNVIRAFHNVCAHRSMKLVWGESGKGGRFTCPYHAWLYASDGTLLHVPDQESFTEVNKAECSLKSIACDVWEGFVFINLNPEQSLAEFMGPLAERLKDVPFNAYPNIVRITASLNSNWKLAMESQGEAYHVRMLHAKTVSGMLSSKENPFVHPIGWEAFGAHRLGSVPRNPDFTLDPHKIVQSFAFMNTTHMVVEGADSGGFAGYVNPFASNVWGNDQYLLFPNLIFHIALSGWWIHRYFPVAPGKCRWEYVGYYKEPTSLREEFAIEYAVALNRDTLMEDNFAVEKQQQVMSPEIHPTMYYGDGEVLCRHMAAVMESALRVPNDDVPMRAAAE